MRASPFASKKLQLFYDVSEIGNELHQLFFSGLAGLFIDGYPVSFVSFISEVPLRHGIGASCRTYVPDDGARKTFLR